MIEYTINIFEINKNISESHFLLHFYLKPNNTSLISFTKDNKTRIYINILIYKHLEEFIVIQIQ